MLSRPCERGEEHEHRDKLKSACKHIERKEQLAEIREIGEIACGTDSSETGTDIADTRKNCGKGGDQISALNAKQKRRECNERNEHREIYKNALNNGFFNAVVVNLNGLHYSRIDGFFDIADASFCEYHYSRYLDSAAR